VNGGNNDYASGGTDLDGNPRIVAGAVDVGAFELSTPQPVAYTLPVTAIGSNQATLNGFAVANGLPTLAWFEWGDLTGFGQHTPPVSAGSSSNFAPVTVICGVAAIQPMKGCLTSVHAETIPKEEKSYNGAVLEPCFGAVVEFLAGQPPAHVT